MIRRTRCNASVKAMACLSIDDQTQTRSLRYPIAGAEEMLKVFILFNPPSTGSLPVNFSSQMGSEVSTSKDVVGKVSNQLKLRLRGAKLDALGNCWS